MYKNLQFSNSLKRIVSWSRVVPVMLTTGEILILKGVWSHVSVKPCLLNMKSSISMFSQYIAACCFLVLELENVLKLNFDWCFVNQLFSEV